jgi:hypothetical protein
VITLLVGVAVIVLVAIFGVVLARWAGTLRSAERQDPEADPASLRSWRFLGASPCALKELTLESGVSYRQDDGDWFAWPSGVEVRRESELDLALRRYSTMIYRKVPDVMKLETPRAPRETEQPPSEDIPTFQPGGKGAVW